MFFSYAQIDHAFVVSLWIITALIMATAIVALRRKPGGWPIPKMSTSDVITPVRSRPVAKERLACQSA